MCEICGQPYTVPGPLDGPTQAGLLVAFAGAAAAATVFVHALLLAGGVVPYPARCGLDYTRPWKRGVHHLFEASDLDRDGRMSVHEMRSLAEATGEPDVTEEMLRHLVERLGFDEQGLTEKGLLRTYWLPGNDTQLWVDFQTFDLLDMLQHTAGDLHFEWFVVGLVLAAAALWEMRPLLWRAQAKSYLLPSLAALASRPWCRRWVVCVSALLGLCLCLVAWSVEDFEGDGAAAGHAAATGGRIMCGLEQADAIGTIARALVLILVGGALMVLEAHATV